MFTIRFWGFHSEIYRDGEFYCQIAWDRDGSRARALIEQWEKSL